MLIGVGRPIEAITSTSVNVLLNLECYVERSHLNNTRRQKGMTYIIFIDDSGQEHYGVVKRFEVDPSLLSLIKFQ